MKLKRSKRARAIDTLWEESDDAIGRVVYLSELYDDVPKELINVFVHVDEFHTFSCDKETRKKVIKWLNED